MLILSRRAGEILKIGEDIAVTVLGIKGGQVRLGIDAPRGMQICREEPQFPNKKLAADPSEGDDKAGGEESRV
ncbi:MAG: carbon storage regulator [Gammaproteobacteria bacterium]